MAGGTLFQTKGWVKRAVLRTCPTPRATDGERMATSTVYSSPAASETSRRCVAMHSRARCSSVPKVAARCAGESATVANACVPRRLTRPKNCSPDNAEKHARTSAAARKSGVGPRCLTTRNTAVVVAEALLCAETLAAIATQIAIEVRTRIGMSLHQFHARSPISGPKGKGMVCGLRATLGVGGWPQI